MPQTQSEISTARGAGFVPIKLTYEDFLHEYYGRKVEYVNSEVIEHVTVGVRHDQLTRFLGSLLQIFVEEHGLGRVLGERFQMKMEFEDGIRGREPDVFIVKKENLSRLFDSFFEGGADLAIEIISPDSVVRDTVEKFHEYQTAG